MYNKLVTKVNNIDTSGFVLKTKYDTDKSELENKIPDTSDLVKKTDYHTKITEIKHEIPDICNLATKAALTIVQNKIPEISNLAAKSGLTTVDNKIPNVSSLVKKTDYNTGVAQIDTKLSNLDGKITKTKTKLEDALKDLILYSLVNSMFDGSGYPAYLIFHPVYKYFKTITNTDYILSWKYKGLSAESIKPPATSDNSLTPTLSYYDYSSKIYWKLFKTTENYIYS